MAGTINAIAINGVTTYTSGTVVFSTASFANSNGVSFGTNGSTITASVETAYQSQGAYLTTAMASNRGSDFLNVTAGLNLTNISATLASNSISLSVGAGAAVTGISGVIVSDATYTSGTVSFSGQNNITIGSSVNGASQYIKLSVGNYITTGALSGDTSKYVQAWEITGNTSGTTSSAPGTKVYFSGGNNVTLSGNGNTIVVSGANIGGAQTGISGIIASDATYTSGTVSFSAQNNITIGSSVNGASQYIKLSVGNYITTGALSGDTSKYIQNWKLTGNTAGTTSSAQGTDLWIQGTNGITVSGSSNTIVFSGGAATLSSYEPFQAAVISSTAFINFVNATSNSIAFIPFTIHNYVSAGCMNLLASMSFVTIGTSSGRQTGGIQIGLYSQGTGTNSSILSRIVSTKVEWSVTGNNSTYSISQPTATSYTGYGLGQTTSAGVNISSGYTGMKIIAVPINTLLTPGAYWLAHVRTNSTSSTNFGISASMAGFNFVDTKLTGLAPMGSFSTAYSSTGFNNLGGNWYEGGLWTSAGSVTGLVDSVALASISLATAAFPYLYFWST